MSICVSYAHRKVVPKEKMIVLVDGAKMTVVYMKENDSLGACRDRKAEHLFLF